MLIGISKEKFNYKKAFLDARINLNEEIEIFLEGYSSKKYVRCCYKEYMRISKKFNNMLFK